MNQFLGFDPLKYLYITNLKNQKKDTVSQHLLNKISQYFLIRVFEILPIEEIKSINEPDKLFLLAQNKIPNFNEKIKTFLEDFRKEFSNDLVVK